MTGDAGIFEGIFTGEGAHELTWEVASRCDCYTDDSRQPQWDCADCGGLGAVYAAPTTIRGLFRSQARWTSTHSSGEHSLGEAQLTVPTSAKPGYVDRRIRDRYTVLPATGDRDRDRVFYPAAVPVPFLFNGVQYAWRVQLQSVEQATRTRAQP